MTDDLFTVLGYDPGGTTGWALLSLHPEAINPGYRILDNVVFWTCGQFVGTDAAQGRDMALLAAAWPHAQIVVEDFILRTERKDRELLTPVRVTTAFETALSGLEETQCCNHACKNGISLASEIGRAGSGVHRRTFARRPDSAQRGVRGGYYLQQPSLAKRDMPDERLQAAEQAQRAGVGFYSATRGMPHARDAVRHVLTFARREAAQRTRGRSLVLPDGLWPVAGE